MTLSIDDLREWEERHHGPFGEAEPVADIGEIDLAPFVRGEAPETNLGVLYRDDGQGLFYRPGVNDLHGEPGTGKSLVTQVAIAGVLRAGDGVVCLDYEGTARTFVERLRVLGVADEVIADPSRVCYANMPGRVTPNHITTLKARMESLGAAFVGVDAMLPALARSGLDDNSNTDVAHYYENSIRPLADAGVAVVTIDHIVKDSAGRGRGARGAGAKLQFVDMSYSLKPIQAFSKHQEGSFKLVCDKDRHGNFAAGSTVAVVKVTPSDDGLVTVTVEAPQQPGEGGWQPTTLMERISKYMERQREASPIPPSKTDIYAAVTGRREWKTRALDELVAGGWVRPQKDGRFERYWLNAPYQEGDQPPDQLSDVPAECPLPGPLVGPGQRDSHSAPERDSETGSRTMNPPSWREETGGVEPKRFTR
jgi:AAA domain